MNYEHIPLANRTRDYLPANPADALISFDLCGEIFWKIIGKGAVARPRGDCRIPRENGCPALDCPYNVGRRAIDEHEVHCYGGRLDNLVVKGGQSGSVMKSGAGGPRDSACRWSGGTSSRATEYQYMDVANHTTKVIVE